MKTDIEVTYDDPHGVAHYIAGLATKAYSGKTGCACGCNGNYYVVGDSPNDTKQFNRISKKVVTALNEWAEAWHGGDENEVDPSITWIYVWATGAVVEYGNRTYALHSN